MSEVCPYRISGEVDVDREIVYFDDQIRPRQMNPFEVWVQRLLSTNTVMGKLSLADNVLTEKLVDPSDTLTVVRNTAVGGRVFVGAHIAFDADIEVRCMGRPPGVSYWGWGNGQRIDRHIFGGDTREPDVAERYIWFEAEDSAVMRQMELFMQIERQDLVG